MSTTRRKVLAALASGSLTVSANGQNNGSIEAISEIRGAGASFPSKVYKRWADRYASLGRTRILYEPTGSGDGIKQAQARTVAFGGTDSPLTPTLLQQHGLVQIPTVVGGVVPVVNLPGIENNRLLLDGPTLADVMAGAIDRWDDRRIRTLNPGLPLPSRPIVRVVRSDRSGTSEGFSRYLALMSTDFRTAVGAGSLPKWPGSVRAEQGNDGVAAATARTEGAITYVSFDRVGAPGLTPVRLVNADGRSAVASEAGFRAAIRASDLHAKGDDLAPLLHQPGADTWPITLTSFVLLDARPKNPAVAEAALRFVYWCFMHGDSLTQGTGFAALPVSVQARLASRLNTVRGPDGQSMNFVVL